MAKHRDEFTESTKRAIARRAGAHCSRCQTLTVGPDGTPDGTVSVGIAAHIRAAAENGPRYDPAQSSEDRRSVENGIWCCGTCSLLVDGDDSTYTVEELLKLRAEHYAWVRERLGRPPGDEFTVVDGEHRAHGVGEVTALDIEGVSTIIQPGTRTLASGVGRVTATRIGPRKGGAE